MKTSLDCLVCFLRQARATGILATTDPQVRHELLVEAGRLLGGFDTHCSPPENAVFLYKAFSEILGDADPFARVKQQSNVLAGSLLTEMAGRVKEAEDSLLAAVRVAIGGNIIDYAAQHVFDAEQTMADCLDRAFAIDDSSLLLQKLAEKKQLDVLYLCDNCGEIFFDTLLVKELKNYGCRVTAAVRKYPIINDATMEDALACGLDTLCPVITNGTACPGTPLRQCSNEFQRAFASADLIISKGMGNFETLSETAAPLFFLFTVKCAEVARHVTSLRQLASGTLSGSGEMVLMKHHLF